MDDAFDHVSVIGNTSGIIARTGPAEVSGALAIANFTDHAAPGVTVSNSVVANNRAIARAPRGAAIVRGAGLFNDALLRASGMTITGNVGIIRRGGGVSIAPLRLAHSTVRGNRPVTAGAGSRAACF